MWFKDLQTKKKSHDRLCGKKAFILHDTYGFPIDIVNDIVESKGMTVDLLEFEQCIQEQKQRARMAWKGDNTTILQHIFNHTNDVEKTLFIGYHASSADAFIQQLYSAEGMPIDSLQEGEYGYCVLTQSPFYATAGGQESDFGIISTQTATAECIGADLAPSGAIVHSICVTSGVISKNSLAKAHINESRRQAIAKNHTATHLAFAALRSLISPNIRQAGSLVTTEKLRFDYTSIEPLTQEQIKAIEKEVNTRIQQAIPANVFEMEYQQAIEQGAISLAGESYADIVRVVSFADCSSELCCGTHVQNTGEIGLFAITAETGLATGIRRIEAVTGMQALIYLQEQRETLTHLALQLKCPLSSVLRQVELLTEEKKKLHKQYEEQSMKLALYIAKNLEQQKEQLSTCSLLTHLLPDATPQLLKTIVDTLKPAFTYGVIALASHLEDTVHIVIYTGKEFKKYTAKELLKHIAPLIDAKGGGKADFVQAGGKNPNGITYAFTTLRNLLL